jgi:hypothetical protein
LITRCFGLVLIALLAGCGERSEPVHEKPLARVFTVPDELPPPASKAPPRARTVPARTVTTAPAASGAPTDAEVGRDLARALGVSDAKSAVDQAGLTGAGMATVPPSAPGSVRAIITAANQVARAPYRYGGGHGGVGGDESWVDTAYDCSGSVSFALASAGLVDRQLDSTSFMGWGEPGPGKWVTVYANAGHAFMTVAGLRFDTVERARTGTRWGAAPRRVGGFTARHPKGL